jgi:hypothetical protein
LLLNEPAEMNADEYRAMIELAKNAGPEECEMCGSIKIKKHSNKQLSFFGSCFLVLEKKWKIFIPCLDLFSVQEYLGINFVIDLLFCRLLSFFVLSSCGSCPFGDGSLSIGFHRSVQLRIISFSILMFVYYSALKLFHIKL